LTKAIEVLKSSRICDDIRLVVFGTSGQSAKSTFGSIPTTYLGYVHDDIALRIMYCAADVVIVPSRLESFGQTASEAIACGTPVVAFKASGLLDVVEDNVTGFLATPYDAEELGRLVIKVLTLQEREYLSMSRACRERAVSLWSYSTVASAHISLYDRIVKG